MSLHNVHSVVFLGECMIEHRADGHSFFGGDTFNTAWYLRQLTQHNRKFNWSVEYATGIGRGENSQKLISLITHAGIGVEYCVMHNRKELGEYWVTLSPDGERTFRFKRDQSAARDYFSLPNQLEAGLTHKHFDAIYLSGISLAILSKTHRTQLFALLTIFKSKGGMVFFDNNFRAKLWHDQSPITDYDSIMNLADIAFLTDEDEYAVFGTQTITDIVDLHTRGQHQKQMLVIRQGEKPCVIKPFGSNKLLEVASQPLRKDQVIDTCAAGDAFAAGFLAKWLVKQDINDAALFAHKVAATVIQHQGAIIPSQFITALASEEFCSVENID